MTNSFSALGLPELIASLLFIALNAYVLMGGADLGSGLWDLLATGPRRAEQRQLIASAIGPIWEANHVWLVIAVVLCFTAFPPAFATLTTILHIPLSLMLIGIVLRGSAFVFRSYGGRDAPTRARWGRTFAIASIATPVLLGIVIGAVSTGAVAVAQANASTASFIQTFITPWLAPFPIAIGLLTLMLFAQLAATYLTVASDNRALCEDFRRRALGSAVAGVVIAGVAARLADAQLWFGRSGLWSGPRSGLWLAATALAAGVTIGALWLRRYSVARVAVAAEASLILGGWAIAQYPYLIPTAMTIRDAAAPRSILVALLWALAMGSVLLIPSLGYLLKTFARSRET